MIHIKKASLCPDKCRQSSPELKTATLVDFCPLSLRSPAHPCDATYKIKIELRVLTIPGRLSSDLHSIVIPVFPFCSAILCYPPSLSSFLFFSFSHSSTPAPPLSLSYSLFLNPRRFRPCRVEFESTVQNRGVTKASYVSRRHEAMEGCAPFLNPVTRAVRRRSARIAPWNAFSDPLLVARCSARDEQSSAGEADNRIITALW